ncbi:hypothetical protein AGDE_04316 [Angomonas deanei]|uniref:Uncharacterized protein n=1 Tax=Angomonas deanei TaxID=59799 RepID=S9UIV2_9TRYP|nr:hypothetical protein AGDE_10354 [Angomonas deanei]EPY39612.1 hypothetical protein AGDE_04316 [Angomonas deanei]CAD2222370.1 hypothetical protein ADEAN_000991400 [Angomonas deanei]|eukprot:EPY28644.1 hypothetical protein AGDE_10354 [Angomonas deanei]
MIQKPSTSLVSLLRLFLSNETSSMSELNLVVNITCNPPVISIYGPVRESTIDHLNDVLPGSCSTTNTGKVPFKLVRKDASCWHGELKSHFATNDIGTSHLFVSLLDALEEEGSWRLRGSTALNHDGNKCTYRFFFVRGAH